MRTVYEVIRILDRRPVFLGEHLKRLEGSLAHYHVQDIDIASLRERVHELAKIDERDHFNVRIDIDIETKEVFVKTVDGVYPDERMQATGVKVIIFDYLRENPNVKAWNQDLREEIDELKKIHTAFEVVYIDRERVLEGSRSNVFFVTEDSLVTSPDEEVLLGVTRQKVLECCDELGVKVEKRAVTTDELPRFKGSFLTGTSINMLPIRKFDDLTYQVNSDVFVKVRDAFLEKVRNEN